MAFTTIASSQIEVGKATKKELWTKVKDNEDDHESRITLVETGASKVVVFNKIIERPPSAGDICHSYLTEAEFQTRYGVGWVLADGDSITGSDLASLRTWSTVPDSRGRFLRMKDHGLGLDTGGDRALGNNQIDSNDAHTHTTTLPNATTALAPATTAGWDQYITNGDTNLGAKVHTSSSNGSESKPVNTCANIFVRINDATESVEIWRAPFGFSIVSAICTTLTAGSAGSLEVDVQKGSDLSSMASIFSTLPSTIYSDGNYTSSTNGVISTANVSLSDWLRLDISSLQTNQTNFQMYLIGELS